AVGARALTKRDSPRRTRRAQRKNGMSWPPIPFFLCALRVLRGEFTPLNLPFSFAGDGLQSPLGVPVPWAFGEQGGSRMPRYLPYLFSAVILALLVAGPLIYARQKHAHLRKLQVVHDGVLYRSGQLSPAGLKRVAHDYRIRTVVTL